MSALLTLAACQMRFVLRIVGCISCFVIAGCSFNDDQHATAEPASRSHRAGLPTIGAAPALVFAIPDSIGGASAEMGRVVRLSSGGFAMADWDGHRLLVFDSTGALRRIVGRAGSGPGEFQSPTLIQALGADSVVVWDPYLRRLSWIDTRTGHGRNVVLGSTTAYGGTPVVGMLHDGRVVVRHEQILESSPGKAPIRRTALLLLDREGGRVGLIADSFMLDVGDARGYRFFQPSLQTATDGDRVYAGVSSRWQIAVHSPDGRADGVLSREWEPEPVTEQVKAEIRSTLDRPDVAPGFLGDDRFDQTVPAFGRIMPSSDGSVWVLGYAAPYQGPDSASVFNHDRRFLGSVALPSRFRPTDVGPDYLVGSATRDDGDLEIRMYPVRWTASDAQ